MKIYLTSLLLAVTTIVWGETSYKGFIGKYPVELLADIEADGDVRAVYAYTNHDTPISLMGTLRNGRLELLEKEAGGAVSATLLFTTYSKEAAKLHGQWIDKKTCKTLAIELHRQLDTDEDDAAFTDAEILQQESLDYHYFKLLLSKTKDDSRARVSGIKVIEKKTDSVLHHFELDCQFMGMYSVSVDDYNFDGFTDFSVYHASYAGPNTSSFYFLYNPALDSYFESEFGGVSLEFDSATKTIHEMNQCCAGSTITTAIYKVVNNKMVLIEEHCFIRDEESGELVERGIRECQ